MSTVLKFTVEVDDKVIEDIINTINRWYGIKPTQKQVIEILEEDHRLTIDILEEFDTVMRESFLDAWAYKYVGENWPIGMTSDEETLTFYKKLVEVCKQKNILYDVENFNNAIRELTDKIEQGEGSNCGTLCNKRML